MMPTTLKTRLSLLLAAGVAFAAICPAAAQTPAPAATPVAPPALSVPATAAPAAPAAAPTAAPGEASVSEVTVTGTRGPAKVSASANVLRLDSTSAASCNFTPGADNYMEDYIASFTRTTRKGRSGNYTPTVDAEGNISGDAGEGFFSSSSPLGNTANPGAGSSFFSNFGVTTPGAAPAADTGRATACNGSDKTIVAGRADIARRDKTLPEGYALFDQGKYAEALEMFKKAHSKLRDNEGGTDASMMIGKIYLDRLGPQSNVTEAITWLKKAGGARFDTLVTSKDRPAFDPRAPYSNMSPLGEASMLLAKIYLAGYGVPKDPKAARRWLDRANEVGVVPAAKSLGDIYYYGFDTPQDFKMAAKYYKEAATLGFVPAQFALAEIYHDGDLGTPDPKTALAWYAEAAKLDHPGALYALAVAYDTGEGVAADPKKALAFYTAAATKGNLDAQSAMGTSFYQGEGVGKDLVIARQWFEAAAVQGQSDAMFNLGAMLMKGEGGDKDLVKAWVWFRLAQTKGHPNAAVALAALEKRMTGEEKQAATAIVTPKKAG